MSRLSPLVILALLGVLAACTDRAGPGPTAPPDSPAVNASAPKGPSGSQRDAATRAARQHLARRVALALADPGFRGYVKDALDHSPVAEHKLQFQRWLQALDRRALKALAKATRETDSAVDAEARMAPALEFYMPVPAHRSAWKGGADILVATALEDHESPVAFDLRGRRHLLRADTPPATPVLAVVPVETDFDTPSFGHLLPDDGGGGGGGGGGLPAPSPAPGLYMTASHFVQDFESEAKAGEVLRLRDLRKWTYRGDHLGDQGRPTSLPCGLLLVLHRSDRLPPVAIVLARHKPAVHLEHHHRVSVPQLAGDDLGGGARLGGPYGPAVAAIPEFMALDAEPLAYLAVVIAHVVPLETGEQGRFWQLDRAQRLHVRPGPLRDADDPLPTVGFGAGSEDLAPGEVHIPAP